MGSTFSFIWEDKLILFIQQFMTGLPVRIASLITEFGDATILVAVIGIFYWALNKELGKKLVVYLSFVNMINPCIKSIVRRLRPYMVNRDIKCLKPVSEEGDIYDIVAQEYSFPSGHAVNSISVYGPLYRNSRRRVWKVILIILIVLIGISRFSLGVHYPTDILAGWLVSAVSIIVYSLIEKGLGRNRAYILLDILGLAGFFIARTNDYYTGYGMMVGATLAIMFEEKYVRFDGTRKPVKAVLRTLIGALLFLGLNGLLKLPFTDEFLNSGTVLSFSVRAARYAVVVFLLLGIYPMLFKKAAGPRKDSK